MNFAYIPGFGDDHTTCSNSEPLGCTLDFSHDYPQLADTIKIEALKSFTAAFDRLPAFVRSYRSRELLAGSNYSRFEHTLYVSGTWVAAGVFPRLNNGPLAGYTPFGSTDHSTLYYLSPMSQAQVALGSPGSGGLPYQYFRPNYPPTTQQGLADLQKLATAIGRALGNTGAHETGHQLNLPYIECSSVNDCENGNIYLYQYATAGAWFFTGQPILSWGDRGTCALQNYLLPGTCKP